MKLSFPPFLEPYPLLHDTDTLGKHVGVAGWLTGSRGGGGGGTGAYAPQIFFWKGGIVHVGKKCTYCTCPQQNYHNRISGLTLPCSTVLPSVAIKHPKFCYPIVS